MGKKILEEIVHFFFKPGLLLSEFNATSNSFFFLQNRHVRISSSSSLSSSIVAQSRKIERKNFFSLNFFFQISGIQHFIINFDVLVFFLKIK